MSSRPARRTALAASVAVALGPLLAGCAAGQQAISKQDYAPSDGLLGEVGDLRVQNVLVVAPPEGGDTAVLSMSVADGGGEPDRLVEVSAGDTSTTRIEGQPEVAAGGVLRVGGPDADTQVLLVGLAADPGATVALRLRFARAGELTLVPPVVAPSGYYENLVAPTPTPTPTVTPTASPTPTSTPS